MAVLLGTSGAWATLEASLRLQHLEASHPNDLAPLLQEMARLCQQEGIDLLYRSFDDELEETGTQIDQACRQFAVHSEHQTKSFSDAIAQADSRLSEYRSHSWAVRWTTFLLPTLRTLSRKKRLSTQKEQMLQTLRADLAARQQKYVYKRQNRDEMVRLRFQQVADKVLFLEQTLQSPELAGARAELEVEDCLKTLPDSFYVCGDVRLRARRKIRFNGEFLQSAQVDYLVVGPTGVFVMEVKRWSKQFIEQQNYFNPYEQVSRASYLCYDILKMHFSNIRVRTVLVNCGVLPPCSPEWRGKVVSLPQLGSYLTRSHTPLLDKAKADQIARLLYEG